MVMDEPLDFEEEDPLLPSSRPAKRKKIIGLDDLLLDFFENGKDELKVKAGYSKLVPKSYNSDDEDMQGREKEIKFCKFVEDYEEQAKGMDARDDVPPWGQRVFGYQELKNCELLQSSCANEQLGFDLKIGQGEGFLDSMLMDGWLLKLVHVYGSVEDSIASWTLTKLLYSSNKKLQLSATDFWDSVLSLDKDGKPVVKLGYFPSYSVLKCAILSYGYLFDTPGAKTSTSGCVAAEKCVLSSHRLRQNNSLLLTFPSFWTVDLKDCCLFWETA